MPKNTLPHRLCDICNAIRRSRVADPMRVEQARRDSYWSALEDSVPETVRLDMDMEMLHATHHVPSLTDAVLIVGVRTLVAHFTDRDVVERQEMTDRLNEQSARHHAEIDAEKAKAREDVEERHGAEMRELQIRVANIEALVSRAFHNGRRKTLRTEDIRAAIDWRTGDQLPEATVEEQARLIGLGGLTPR